MRVPVPSGSVHNDFQGLVSLESLHLLAIT